MPSRWQLKTIWIFAYFRYNFPIAQTDYARTKAGGSVNGVNTGIVQSSTQGGFSGGGSSSAGASSGSAAGAGGLVTSTLRAGPEPDALSRRTGTWVPQTVTVLIHKLRS